MRINNDERKLWINNDERLYIWRLSEGGSMIAFIRRNKEAIDRYIRMTIGGEYHGY